MIMSALKGKKILIVDDEPMLREILRDVLEFEGALIKEAENGNLAFELLQSEPFQAVISDIRMPGGDGLQLLENLRRQDFVTPVVMLITGFSDLSHDAAYDRGADAVLAKPFDVNELLNRLTFLLSSAKDRLSEKPAHESARAVSVDSSAPIKLGRGGMFVPKLVDCPIGTWVSFETEIKGLSLPLSGIGIVRWVRKGAKESLTEGSGVEFRYLDAGSLTAQLDFIEHNPTRAFIPDRS